MESGRDEQVGPRHSGRLARMATECLASWFALTPWFALAHAIRAVSGR